MKRIITGLLLCGMLYVAVPAQDWTARFDAQKMRERVKRLSADDLEGRGPGTNGGRIATEYIVEQLKAAGVKPADHGSYYQNVKLVGVKADPMTVLTVKKGDGTANTFRFGDDFVATTGAQAGNVAVHADIVFVGYGIDAPQYRWNDYKGTDADCRGKVLMMLVNDPPATKDEPGLFGGKALTYFGRWTYKYEEAARRGAAGVILVHTTESAGYGWNVVHSSNGNWRYEIAREPGDKTPFLQFKAWATQEASAAILRQAGLDLRELIARSSTRDFKPINLGLKADLNLKSETKTFESPNVVGTVLGSDPKLSSEYVAFSAHWDHLGIGEPDAKGDRIYNGAYDNASGVAALLGIAEVLAKTPRAERPKRSFLFLFPTAEEQGLLGAEYYSTHPLIPLDKTAADVNIDGVNFFGKVSDFMPLGAERSSLAEDINAVASARGMRVKADTKPEQGFFFRSDHFPFAKVGVPSVSLQHGDTFIKPLSKEAEAFFKDYNARYYHQVSDEYHDWWDMTAMVQEAELTLAIGMRIADSPSMPHFNASDEFAPADAKRSSR